MRLEGNSQSKVKDRRKGKSGHERDQGRVLLSSVATHDCKMEEVISHNKIKKSTF